MSRIEDILPSLDSLAHYAVTRAFEKIPSWLHPGAEPLYAVDATAGNGYDTLFLAGLMGAHGEVHAFDLQPEALEITLARLNEAGLRENVRLVDDGHELLERHLPQQAYGRVIAAMFNLGFLPGSDKTVVTRPDTTLRALDALVPFLAPRAVLSVHLYTGHEGGRQESETVLAWAGVLDRQTWRVLVCSQHNKPRNAEHLLLIEKRA